MSRFTTSLEWLLGRIRLPRVRTTARSIGMRVLHGLIILSLLAQSSAGIVARASALEPIPLQTGRAEEHKDEPPSSQPLTAGQSEPKASEHQVSPSDEWHDVFLPLVARGYPPPPTLIGTGGGEAVTSDGNVRVEFPAGAVAEPVLVYIQTPGATMPPETLSGEPIEIVAQEADSGQPVTQFQAPITVEVAYDETLLHGNENDLSLFYFDEAEGEWLPLPTLVDTEANHLMGLTSHLSVFDFDVQSWEAFRLPSMADFQVASFTGAATYAYSLQLPSGPGGLQPDLTLSYNSQVVDSAHARMQAAWVGMGWSLDTGYIQRNMNESVDSSGDDTFNLTVAGVSSMLLPGEDGYYHATDETFWRIKYDAQADTWTVWDKTGTRYLFAHQARYPEYRKDDCSFLKIQTWRWSLTEVRNAFGEVMTYRYAKESKTSRNYCDKKPATTDLAVYPAEIIYPHGRYRIVFVRTGREDYIQKWATWDQFRIFFQQSLLNEVRVEHDTDGNGDFDQVIRRYVFNYEADPGKLIFPNVHWLSPEKPPTPTPTLAQVQEFGLNGNALPTTIFFYDDDMHLTRVENGYGGRLEFEYGVNPWHEIESDSETEKKNYKDGQFVRDELVVTQLSQDEYYPGGEYRLATRVKVDNTQWVQMGIDYGDAAVYSDQVYLNTQPIAATFTFTRVLELPATAAEMRPLVKCNRCTVYNYTLTRLPTRYRVVEKRVFDGLDPNPDVFTYRYDEPATNDEAHSEGVANTTEDTRYVDAYSEFRGHSMAQEIGPDGRAVTTWFHQDDARKGRASVTSVGTQTFWDPFDALNPLAWTFTHSNTQQLSERFGGDPAFKSTNPNPDWMVQLARQGYILHDGDAVLVQFRVATTDTHALLAIDSGTWGQPDYRRWGINARDGAVYVSLFTAGGQKEDRVLLSPFKVDTWYVLQLVVDDNHKFVMRVWERNEPDVLGWYEDAAGDMPDGRQWRFLQMTWDGTVWLDSYSEGRLYNETVTSYATNERPSSGEIPCKKGACGDLKILWTRLVWEKTLIYEGDASSVARRIEYRYEEADQGGKQYGNVTHVIEKSWDGTEFVPYRATWTKYYPTATSDTYLVGLAGFSNQYACRQGTCDYTNATLLASSLNLYDGHTQFDLPPSAGILTGQRTLLRFAGANQTDPRYSDVTYAYDDWGNLIQTTTYSGEGSALVLVLLGLNEPAVILSGLCPGKST